MLTVDQSTSFAIVGDCQSCDQQGSSEIITDHEPRDSDGFIVSIVFFVMSLIMDVTGVIGVIFLWKGCK